MRFLELKIPPLVVVLLLGALMAAVARIGPGPRLALPAGPFVAAGLAAAGGAIIALGAVSFRRARTTVNPLRPESSSSLVTTGIYRRTRNPMYLGMLLALLGWALFLDHAPALLFAAAFVPLMNRLQIIPEERALAAMFGPGFAAYRAMVRRWL
jgi:protein-S-isoprenylcysteine O-methyltransferase Ste14